MACPNAPAFAASPAPTLRLPCREESLEMFRFGYGQYMQRAFPKDDLRPISCRGKNSQGGIALTLIDSLDTLIVRGCCRRVAACCRLVAALLLPPSRCPSPIARWHRRWIRLRRDMVACKMPPAMYSSGIPAGCWIYNWLTPLKAPQLRLLCCR